MIQLFANIRKGMDAERVSIESEGTLLKFERADVSRGKDIAVAAATNTTRGRPDPVRE